MNTLPYLERANLCTNSIAKRLFTLMANKQSNLAVSADVTTAEQLLYLAEQVGPTICLFKTHIDIITDFTPVLIQHLKKLADKHQFLLFEDRKFADIGNTVLQQFCDSVYHIADWADIVNAHLLPGEGIINGLRQGNQRSGLLLIAQMSSTGNLLTKEYTQANIIMANKHADLVIGFICQQQLSDNPCFIHMTPGVQLEQNDDNLGQHYSTPEYVITEKGSDLIIVGRGIYQATNPQKSAEIYRQRGWKAYQSRLRN